MAEGRKLPIGIQTFEELRRENYLYVDKTQYVWKLVSMGKTYFLSRPRRFGKSLFISTLEAYFLGKKELFKGLAIERMEDEQGENAWTEYPVVTFSLSSGSYNSKNGLEDVLNAVLEDAVERYELTGEYRLRGDTLPVRFMSLIRGLYRKTGKPVVVLVDEYDKPLLETMVVNPKQEEANRQLYKEFFSVLKDADQYLKFEFFTGVTKFSKVSIFSDLNHLRDISLSNSVSGICGITENELRAVFEPEISEMAKERELSEKECLEKLARSYDGYRFSPEGENVYNPFSLLNAFDEKDFGSYWFETGTPTFLINKLRVSDFTTENLTNGVDATEEELKNYRAESTNPIPLFYQSGYLTIRRFDRRFRLYSLSFPNDEVEYGFLNSLIPTTLGQKEGERPLSLVNMILDLEKGNIEMFLKRLKSLFGSIPYPENSALKYEEMWRDQIFLVLKLMGMYVGCEVHTSGGRCDCMVQTGRFIYLFEFKMDKTAEEAVKQIDSRDYGCQYEADDRKIVKIGVNFRSDARNIGEWIVR